MMGGVGLALNAQAMGLGLGVPDDCTNRIEWLPDGRVRIDVGAPDMGQGLYTAAAQIAAEALQIPYDRVEVATPNTAFSPNGGVPCASRMTYLMGNAMLLTAQGAIDVLLDEAARQLDQPREALRYAQGFIELTEGGERIDRAELTSRAAEDERPLAAQATFSFPYPPGIVPDNLPIGMPHVMFGYSAHLARVDVDPELGTVIVREIVAIHDVGKVINRDAVEGQIEGGVAMGIGYALLEEVRLKDGQGWTDSFMEYLLPTALDTPSITTILLETPEPSGPYGAKGVGEMCMTPVAPAIANAVANAVGRRVTSLPVRRMDLIDL
jgi:CO/xanthine dehydrogenase Mo-binding subunit